MKDANKLFGTKDWNSKATITEKSFERDVKAAIKQAENFKPHEPYIIVSPSEYKRLKKNLDEMMGKS